MGRILPISAPIAEALARRRARRDPTSPLVFHRDGISVRRWRTAWRTACQAAGVPTRFLHDCRRTAARNLIRASVPERVAMLLTGHKTRAIFDRYNIINEQELLEAGDQLVEYLAQHAQATLAGGPTRPAPLPRAPRRLSASCDAPPRKADTAPPAPGSSTPEGGRSPDTAPLCAAARVQAYRDGLARDRGTRRRQGGPVSGTAGRAGLARLAEIPDRRAQPAELVRVWSIVGDSSRDRKI